MTDAVAEQAEPGRVPPYARIEVIGGLTIVTVAALIWFGSIDLSNGVLPNFGSGALPRILAILLALAGAGIVFQGLIRREAAFERFDFAWRPTLIVVLAIAIFGLFIRGGNFGLFSTPQLGLCIVGPLTIFIAGCAAPRINVRELLVLAFGLTALILVVFPDLLRLSIPPFPGGMQSIIPPALGPQNALRIACAGNAALAAALYFVLIRSRRDLA